MAGQDSIQPYQTAILTHSDIIQQKTEQKKSPPQQPHTFAISLNAIPQTKKLQKNVAAPPQKRPPKKTKYFWYVALKYRYYIGQKICPTVYNNVYKK